MKKLTGMFAAACLLTLIAPASSQQNVQIVRTESGCVIVDAFGNIAQSAADGARVTWTGGCTPDGLIDGPGMVSVSNEHTAPQWRRYRVEYRTSAVAGLFDGAVEEMRYMDMELGYMEPNSGGRGDLPLRDTYHGGCMDGANWCRPAAGVAARDAFRADARARTDNDSERAEESTSDTIACASTPDETLQRFTEAYNAERAAHPSPQSGAQAQFQYSYMLGSRGLVILEPFRECLAQHYAPNRSTLEGMRDQGRLGCEQLSTTMQCTLAWP